MNQFENFMKLTDGDNDISKIFVDITEKYKKNGYLLVQIYLDLKIVKNWYSLKVEENEEMNLCFLLGKISLEKEQEIIMPLISNEFIDMRSLTEIVRGQKQTYQKNKITFAIVDPDSSVLYYEVDDQIETI